MTVDELNVKISADAQSFKSEVAAANSELMAFRNRAVAAAAEIDKAFDGIVSVTAQVTSSDEEQKTVSLPKPVIPETITYGPIMQDLSDMPESNDTRAVPVLPNDAFGFRTAVPQRTAEVPILERSDTLIGALGGGDVGAQPVNITTSVMLDGDKVGESVDRFYFKRNKITNGLGG